MEWRNLDVTIVSAKGFKLEKKERIYAEVYIAGFTGSEEKFKTPVSHVSHEATYATWNFPVKFSMTERQAQQCHLTLSIEIKAKRFFSDKLIGQIRLPIATLIKGATRKGKPMEPVGIQPAGNYEGAVEFTYKFGEIYLKEPKRVVTSTMAARGV